MSQVTHHVTTSDKGNDGTNATSQQTRKTGGQNPGKRPNGLRKGITGTKNENGGGNDNH
jgi:hypothetical protein